MMTRVEQIFKKADERAHEKGARFSILIQKARKTMSAYEIGFVEGAEWADRTMINKACELFRQEVAQCLCLMEMLSKDGSKLIDIEASVELFRKKLEE